MFFKSQRDELEMARNEAKAILDETGSKPKLLSTKNLYTFFDELTYSFELIFEEKEIFFFAVLQWLTIGIAYVLWTEILDWIPDRLWEEIGKSNDKGSTGSFLLVNAVLLAWSFFVVAVVSYPLSLFNAAIVGSHYLRSTNQTSTIAKCLTMAFKHLGKLWIFTTIDAWITVNMILSRLPKRGRDTPRVVEELLYYAWKIGTIGIFPALMAGKGYIEAGKDSVHLLKNNPARTIGIRMGYGLICWVIGIASYVGCIFYFFKFGDHHGEVNKIYHFFSLMIVPIFAAVGIISVLVRPFFLIMISKLYTDNMPLNQEALVITQNKKFDWLALFFAILLSVLLTLYFFGDQLGIREWIESLATKDIEQYRKLSPT